MMISIVVVLVVDAVVHGVVVVLVFEILLKFKY